ncbi:MAG: hypothetical protein Alis3KO_30950 [Aliiglaciecola sp.]
MKNIKSALMSLVVVSASLSLPVQAESISQALKKCGQVQNSLKRLVCYDGIVNDLNKYGGLDELMSVPAPLPATSPNTPSASVPQTSAPQQPAVSATPSRNQDFGMEQRNLRDDTEDKIYATVVSIKKDARKKRLFTLDNGHVWREADGSSLSIKENEVIYVERGAIGSFHMSKDSVNRRIRVSRVK